MLSKLILFPIAVLLVAGTALRAESLTRTYFFENPNDATWALTLLGPGAVFSATGLDPSATPGQASCRGVLGAHASASITVTAEAALHGVHIGILAAGGPGSDALLPLMHTLPFSPDAGGVPELRYILTTQGKLARVSGGSLCIPLSSSSSSSSSRSGTVDTREAKHSAPARFGRVNPFVFPHGAPLGSLGTPMKGPTINGISMLGDRVLLLRFPKSLKIMDMFTGSVETVVSAGVSDAARLDYNGLRLNLDASNPGKVCALADGSVLFSNWLESEIYRLTGGPNGTQTLPFCPLDEEGGASGVDPAAAPALACPYQMLPLGDGSVLVAGNVGDRLCQIARIAKDGKAVTLFAGNVVREDATLVPDSPEQSSIGHVNSMVECPNGDVLLGDELHSRILRITKAGTISCLCGGNEGKVLVPGEGSSPSLVVNRGWLMEAAPNGTLVIYDGKDQIWHVAMNGSLTATPIVGSSPHLEAVEEKSSRLLAPALNRHDPLLYRPQGVWTMTVLEDGTLLVNEQARTLVISPADDLQGCLESLVEEGFEAIQNRSVESLRKVEAAFIALGSPKNPQMVQHAIGATEYTMPNVLCEIISGYTGPTAATRFRIYQAMSVLKAARQEAESAPSTSSPASGEEADGRGTTRRFEAGDDREEGGPSKRHRTIR